LQKPPNTGYWYDRFSVQPHEVADAERQYKRIFEIAELVDKNWPKEASRRPSHGRLRNMLG
jgi:hypothetical protein